MRNLMEKLLLVWEEPESTEAKDLYINSKENATSSPSEDNKKQKNLALHENCLNLVKTSLCWNLSCWWVIRRATGN